MRLRLISHVLKPRTSVCVYFLSLCCSHMINKRMSMTRIKTCHFHSSQKWTLIGLLFERPYLIKGLNLMIPTFAKSADFGKNGEFWNKTADFEKPRISKKKKNPWILLKSMVFRIHKNRGFLCETKYQVCLER